MVNKIALIIGSLLYVCFVVFILYGAGYMTYGLYNRGFNPDAVGLNTDLKYQTAKMAIVIFWLTFVPLSFGMPILLKKQFLD